MGSNELKDFTEREKACVVAMLYTGHALEQFKTQHSALGWGESQLETLYSEIRELKEWVYSARRESNNLDVLRAEMEQARVYLHVVRKAGQISAVRVFYTRSN